MAGIGIGIENCLFLLTQHIYAILETGIQNQVVARNYNVRLYKLSVELTVFSRTRFLECNWTVQGGIFLCDICT